MKLSQKVKKYLIDGQGTAAQQKETAMRLSKLAPADYTQAVLTGEKGVTIGAELLTADDLIQAFEAEIQLMKAVRFELNQQNYFNKIVAADYIAEQQRIYKECIKQLNGQEESKNAL